MEDCEGRDGSGVAPAVDSAVSLHRTLVGLALLVSLTVASLATSATPLADWHTLYTRPSQPTGPTLDLRAVGEVMLARHIAALAERQGSASLLAEVQDLLKGDVTLGNLESPLTTRREALRPGPYRLLAPPELAAVLPAANFTALSLANNHALDAGPEGLADTLATLRAVGVAPVGAGPSEAAALEPVWFEAHGCRLA
ncbi:MAG: CapA family protein, partial [Chloroflexales bacterium]